MTELPGVDVDPSLPVPPLPGSGPQPVVTPDKIPGYIWVVQKWMRFLYKLGFTQMSAEQIWHASNTYASREIEKAGMVIKAEMFVLAGEAEAPSYFLPGVPQRP